MALLQTSSYNPFAALREPLMPVIPPVLNAVAGPSRAAVRTPVELGANCFSNASSVGFDGPTSLTNAGQNVYNFHHSTITSGSLAGPTPPAVPAGANSSPAPYSDQQQISQDSSTHNRGTVTLSGSRQHPSSTYSRLQNEHALGYALYRPQPISSLPAPCREKGVCIGDVGLVTPDGGFDPCFNIYLPAEDPVNIGRTPPNFQPMYPSRMPFEDIDEDHDAWQAGDAKYAGSVSRQQPPSSFSRRSGALFEGSATEGAVLVLPRGGSSYNLRSTNDVFQYIEQHAEEWYDHINKPRSRGGLGRNAINGSLYAITGVDKTTSWGTGAFSGVKGEGKFPLHFRPANREDPSEMRFTHVWDQSGVATTRHGPSCEPLDDTSSRPENQCIFLRGFKVRLSKQSWKSIFSKKTKLQITPIMGPRSDGMSTSKGHHPFSASSRSSRVRAFMQGQSHRSQSSDSESSDDETHIISSIEPPIQQIHPSDAINCYLLEKHPQARLSITHDDTWCAVVAKDGKDALLLPNLLQRVSESNVVHHSHGTVRFGQPDARSAENQIGSSWTQESASETSRASVSPPETPRATYDRLLSSFPSCDFSRVPSTGLTPVHHATFPYYQARITYVTRDYAPEQEDKKAKAHGCRREALLEDIRQQARSIRQSMDELNGRTPRQSWSHYCRDERGYLAARTELDPETMLNQQLDDMSSDRRRPQRDSGESQKYLVDFRSLILDAAPSLSLNTIRGITPDNRAPVYSGGFDDVFRGEWGGKYIFMKAPRLYTASHLNEDVGITDYHQMTEKRPHVPEVWFPGCHPDVGGSYTKNTTRGHADSPLRWTTRECYQIILNSECSRGHAIGIPPENFDKTQLGNDVNATFHPFSWWEQLVRESRLLLMPTHRPSVCDDSLLHLDTSTRMAWSTANGPPHHPLALLHPTALGRPYNHILPPQSESSDTIDNVKAKIHGEDGVSSSEWHLRCRLIPMRPSDLIINSFLGIESSHSQERVDDQECTNSDGCRFED